MTRPFTARATRPGLLAGHARLVLPGAGPLIHVPDRAPTWSAPRSDAARPVRLDLPPGWHTGVVGDLDVVFLIDDSGSMYGPAGDPHGARRAAALSVVNLIARAI